MSSFRAKASLIKAKLEQQIRKQNINNCCSQKQIRIVRQIESLNVQNNKISIQQPIIIERRTVINKLESSIKTRNPQSQKALLKKDIEPFIPVLIPTRDRKTTAELIEQKMISNKTKCQGGNKQIQIQIQREDNNKDCLKKLFKKVQKLTQDLTKSQTQTIRLKLQLQNYKNIEKKTNDFQKKLNALDCSKYKLEVELDILRGLLKDRDSQIQRHRSIVPKQIIKQVIVQKPVQVVVQVFKAVPGPERIVQKIVQIPKYVEIQKRVPYEVKVETIKTVQVPTITQRIVYVDKPIYIDRQIPVHIDRQIPVEVPVQRPIYIDRPYVQEQILDRLRKYQMEIEHLMRINYEIDDQNRGLRLTCDQLAENIQILRRHNQQKNRQVQHLLQNSLDYNPCSPSQDYSLGSVKYTISSKNHQRAI